uniref:Uncharacterized protein n=1 Tax=Trichuris muris TaxID=70415 RepID=A0A5S6R0Z8_TRIMR
MSRVARGGGQGVVSIYYHAYGDFAPGTTLKQFIRSLPGSVSSSWWQSATVTAGPSGWAFFGSSGASPEFPERFLGLTILAISMMMIGKNAGPEFTRRWVITRATTIFQIYEKSWRDEYANLLLSESWARELDLLWDGSLEFCAIVFEGIVECSWWSGAVQRLFWG